jgi:hypothetical protein
LVQKFSRIKVYKALAVPVLVYRRKFGSLEKKDKKLLTSVMMKVFRIIAWYILSDRRNQEILRVDSKTS